MIQKSRLHSTEVLACGKLRSDEGDASPSVNLDHHRVLMILHKENLLEMDLLRLVVGSHQLFLQRW
jgi:hypothetical protein